MNPVPLEMPLVDVDSMRIVVVLKIFFRIPFILFPSHLGADMSVARKTFCDRRGRVFVDGLFLEFETEVETFKALAAKYLKEELILDTQHQGSALFIVASSETAAVRAT